MSGVVPAQRVSLPGDLPKCMPMLAPVQQASLRNAVAAPVVVPLCRRTGIVVPDWLAIILVQTIREPGLCVCAWRPAANAWPGLLLC